MKTLFFAISILIHVGANASECLDISGTFDTNYYGGTPQCAQGQRVLKSWFGYKQTGCKTLEFSKIYKLVDGTFCESEITTYIADGQERPTENPEYAYKLELFLDRQTLTLKSISNAWTYSATKTLDSNGNLVVDESSGRHDLFTRSAVQ